MERESRQLRAVATRFETREEGEAPHLSGYFAVFNSLYDIGFGMSESIAPGAFQSSLGGDVRALTNHDTRLVLGRTSAGTMDLREDETGLWADIAINPNDSDAMNTWARVQRGDVTQCSIGFDIIAEETEYRDDGTCHWTIRDVKLYEVSVCTFPAYEETNVSARSAQRDEVRARKIAAWKERMKAKLKGGKTNGIESPDAPEKD